MGTSRTLPAAVALVLGMALTAGCTAPGPRETVSTKAAPEAIGPYSQAGRKGDLLFLSGQLPSDPSTGQLLKDADIEAQTRRVLDNLKAVLAASDMTMANIVSTSVFLKDLDDFAKMNAVYATYFPKDPPARATVEVSRLPRDVKVEISAIAAR